MEGSDQPPADRYDDFYREFDSPLMRQLRIDAYDEDIGQHSWVRADELRADMRRLQLTPKSRLLDLGCGPCGPLTFILAEARCRGTGVEVSRHALEAGRARAAAFGVTDLMAVQTADLNQPLPFEAQTFDAAISLDVVLHVRDRLQLFQQVAGLLVKGGHFLVTDAAVLTGSVSNEEVRVRSAHGYSQFVAPNFNQTLLETAGFSLIESEDRTESVLRNASGRLTAIRAHRTELENMWGKESFAAQEAYLGTVVDLSRRRAVSRVMYLAKLGA
jgi:cyclopropane fatty-acyl-phospholipid synthase-like methyltransferase